MTGEIPERKIMLTNDLGVMMNYPALKSEKNDELTAPERLFNIITDSIDSIFDSNQIYREFERNDVEDFIFSLSKTQFKALSEFVLSMPRLEIKLDFKCDSCGHENNISYKGLQNFFL